MTTIFDSAAPVKSDRPFGTLPAPERRMPYTAQDLEDAAQMFGDVESDCQLEDMALQATWDDQFLPTVGHCLRRGDRCDDLTVHGLCDRCDTLATDDTIACVNSSHGLGRRVF